MYKMRMMMGTTTKKTKKKKVRVVGEAKPAKKTMTTTRAMTTKMKTVRISPTISRKRVVFNLS